MVCSKNWDIFGNLGIHIGLNKNISENNDGDSDINLFFGFDKELNRSFSFLIEYDAAFNDNFAYSDYFFDDLTFGKGKGYLNAGLRWAINRNFLLEFNFNDINQNTKAKYTNRNIKIMYSESF